ncbi:hypothetical protein J6J08_05915 [Pseudidiomarina sp. 1APR75-33.1]|uniref:hypothetical protein n=1 Tax=Pseudidiomarina terrestris TaxID=2820060 RepID=UPI0026502A26|nr:hypothetical protein [Pseudidiomarina sp. 1APR75-33.1]MDN7126910.1 hypothetical protein [Pseudidiomarina sp. 1APR75-33.1]
MITEACEQGAERIVHITHAKKGIHYHCALCKTPMFPIMGDKKMHHFRHAKGKQAGYKSGLTDLHKQAQLLIKKYRKLVLPNGKIVYFDRVELEEPFHSKTIDCIGYRGHRCWYIEVFVTHKVSEEKLAALRRQNVDVVELDLSPWYRACPSQQSPSRVADLIFKHVLSNWLHRYQRFPRLYVLWNHIKRLLVGSSEVQSSRPPEQLTLDLHDQPERDYPAQPPQPNQHLPRSRTTGYNRCIHN